MGRTFEFGVSRILRGAGLRACSRACLTCEHHVLLEDNTIACDHKLHSCPPFNRRCARWIIRSIGVAAPTSPTRPG